MLPDDEPGWRCAVKFSFCVLLLLALLVHAQFEIGDLFEVTFGYWGGMSVLFVLAFVLPAFGILDWKMALLLLLTMFAGDMAITWIGGAIESTKSVAPVRAAIDLMPSSLILCVSATLLAVALAPFWRSRNAATMQTPRSARFLFLSLAVLLAGITAMGHGLSGYAHLLLGGIAFGLGLIWQARAIIAGPLIILIAYLLAVVLAQQGYRASDDVFELANIGLSVFPFVYLGLLSNRYGQKPIIDAAESTPQGVEL